MKSLQYQTTSYVDVVRRRPSAVLRQPKEILAVLHLCRTQAIAFVPHDHGDVLLLWRLVANPEEFIP